MLYFHLLPIDARYVSIQGESEQGLRGIFSHKEGGETRCSLLKPRSPDTHFIGSARAPLKDPGLVQIALANKYHLLTLPGGETNGEY